MEMKKHSSWHSPFTRDVFFKACKWGQLDILQFHFERESIDIINVTDEHGNTGLMFACVGNHYDTVEFLLQAKASIDIQNINGCTALMLAILHNFDSEISCLLIDGGASPNIRDVNGVTALMIATLNADQLIVKRLIASNASLDLQDIYGCTALMHAVTVNSLNSKCIAQLLLDADASVDIQDEKGCTALMRACHCFSFSRPHFHDHISIMKMLIRCGANVNAPLCSKEQRQRAWYPLDALYELIDDIPEHESEFFNEIESLCKLIVLHGGKAMSPNAMDWWFHFKGFELPKSPKSQLVPIVSLDRTMRMI